MKTLIIDNYDSFTFNLFQYIAELGGNPDVIRNDEKSVDEIRMGGYSHIVISPGPGTPEVPEDIGVTLDVIRSFGSLVPMLGVCLGQQAMIYAFGGRIVHAPRIMHGKTSRIRHSGQGLFWGLPREIDVMRYHSLVGSVDSIPDCFDITAVCSDDKTVQAIAHKEFPMFGVQFHPESVGTAEGKKILTHFLKT